MKAQTAFKDFMATLTNVEADRVILWITANRIRQVTLENVEGLGIINSGFGVNLPKDLTFSVD
jgi:hypothetical protein